MYEHEVRLLEVSLRREMHMREAGEHRLARMVAGRDRMPGWRARLFGRLSMRTADGQDEGMVSRVDRFRQPAHHPSSPERDLVRGVHDLTGLGRRRFVPIPVEIGRDGS